MKMPRNSPASLRDALSAPGAVSARSVFGAEAGITWSDLSTGTVLGGHGSELCGRSVLLATRTQLSTVAALTELDGLARRIIPFPHDVPLKYLPFVADRAAVDAIVSDLTTVERDASGVAPGVAWFAPSTLTAMRGEGDLSYETEWVLLTSGTTGRPKLVVHTFASLTGAIEARTAVADRVVWSTFYDIRRYGGLQIFLRAALTGTPLVLSSAQESTADFLARAASRGVTHISGTPSHWRRALMSPAARLIKPDYVRLSGEIADQAILNQLRSLYPQARISHAFASTEAGVAFDVKDGLTGLPPSVISSTPQVEMKLENGSLRIRSDRTALRYLGKTEAPLKDKAGFVDTGDMLELRGDRYHFAGRRDGVINVGGLKVHPEEVEEVINRHPQVRMSLVTTRKNPITGALVVADVVLESSSGTAGKDVRELHQDILRLCREALPSHKVPAAINFVPALAVAETGKLLRRHA
jgi:acyl-coenzyme A synthetase/AMP-(fatty) acid ligase